MQFQSTTILGIKQLLRTPAHLYRSAFSRCLALLYSPEKVHPVSSTCYQRIVVTHAGHNYDVCATNNCLIYTNCADNITYSVKRGLIPRVSWQWSDEDETALDDSQNRYLKGTLLPRSSPRRARSTVVSLLTGGGGNYNYFHWLYDVLPRIQLCSYFINDDAELLYLVPANNLTFQNDSLSILGIDRDRQISSLASPFILADRCLCSAHPNPYPNASRATPTWIIDFLRNKFLPAASESKFGSLVYIDRADSTNKRQLINDSEVQQQLSANGFESYRLSELSFRDQIRLFSRAKVIVGAHGTGLANLAFAPPGCVIYEIFSHRFQPTMYKSISDHIGGEWIPLIGSEDSGGNAKMSSIYLSSEMVQKIIDRVTSLHGHSARRSRAHS